VKFLCCSDLHGEVQARDFLFGFIADAKPDCILIAGDIANDSANFAEELFGGLEKTSVPFFAVHGNKDGPYVREFIASTPNGIHGRCVGFGGFKICGSGGSTPTPYGTPSEYPEKYYEGLFAKMPIDDKTIILSHAPPKNTQADLIGAGNHGGCQALRDVIEEKKPLAVICGHVHETHLVENLGSTLIVKVAPLMRKHCAVLEVPSLKAELL
jgi:Icc-related predicted phosphoesterase